MHAVLLEHGITPVLRPVFQGFGWKGLRAVGATVPPAEYARYCRYLLARYGAAPAVWLVGADGSGSEPQIAAGSREIEEWDAYGQPTGVHYRPHARNDAHQDAPWLDFQWCQTGHRGEHVPERVADMWRNLPAKAVANGEPTYENTGRLGLAADWWQGHESWSNLCAGGTIGVVYGAAGLWQWRLHPAEPGHQPFFLAPDAGWREALDFEGSRHVGMVAHILAGLPLADMRPDWQLTFAPRGLSAPGRLYLSYAEHGGPLRVHPDTDHDVPRPYRVYDPRTGEITGKGHRQRGELVIPDDGGAPRVFVCCADWAADAP
ncbi:apiosidase-like domain-containing protein [Streptomyces sp. NPDC001858]